MRFRGGEFSTGTTGNFQSELTQPHSLRIMYIRVSRTETKLPPRSRVNCSGLSAEAACKTLPLAHRSYSYSS